MTTIDQKDDYCFLKFVLGARKMYHSLEELKEFFTENYPRVFAKILSGDGYYLKKDTCEDLYSRVKRIDMVFKCMQSEISRGRIVTHPIQLGFESVFEMCQDNLPIYSKEVFKPMSYGQKKYEFNTWTGFVSESDGESDMKVVQPILDFIFEIIAHNNKHNYKYILSWLSHIICKPYKKTEVALFLHSDEKGTGKGSLGYWLKNYLFGTHISNVVSGLSKVVQKHNTVLFRKIFTMVEELPALQGEFHSQFDTMKHVITDPQITIEPKGVDPYEIPNFVNFMLLSNNLMSIKLERGDRRYACFEVNSVKKGDEEYWENIHENVLTESSAKEFYKYLRNLPDENKVSLRQIPKTELRNTLIENSIPVHIKFFEEIKEGTWVVHPNAYLEEFEHKGDIITKALKADTLYRLYSSFCSERKEAPLRYRLFFNSVKKYIRKSIGKIKGSTVQFYVL